MDKHSVWNVLYQIVCSRAVSVPELQKLFSLSELDVTKILGILDGEGLIFMFPISGERICMPTLNGLNYIKGTTDR